VVKANFVGWSGLGPVAMLIEDVFGLEFNAPENLITWDLQTPGRHGLENLRFRDATLTLVCMGVPESAKDISVTVTTDREITLSFLLRGVPKQQVRLQPGTHSLTITA